VRERRLASRQCEDLAEAAAVAITLAFETARSPAADAAARSGREAAARAPSTPDAASAPAGAVPLESRSPVPSPARTSATAGRVETALSPSGASSGERAGGAQPALGAELLIDVYSLPAVVAGPGLSGGLRWARVSVALFGAWFPGTQKTVAPSQRAEFSLLVASARGCYELGQGLVDTALCVGFEGGQFSARGAGLRAARRARDPWLAPQLGLALSSEPWHGLALDAHAEAIAPLLRQGYAVDRTETIHRIRSLGARAGFGFHVAF
jgi:hypothetical protein